MQGAVLSPLCPKLYKSGVAKTPISNPATHHAVRRSRRKAGAVEPVPEQRPSRKSAKSKKGLSEAFEILAAMPADALRNIKDKRPPEQRKGLIDTEDSD